MKKKRSSAITADVFFATISELNQHLKAGDFSAVELTGAFSERLQTVGPILNALALSLDREALHEAKLVDEDLKRERYRGPLQGIPYGAKDLLALKGHPTTWGAKPYQNQVIDETATVITKLAKPGAILVAKLAMVELAGGGGYRMAGASLTGPGLNPWNTSRWSGGSSSGSAIAVAAGLAPFALGSETSGSILTPSAFCGVTGLRPTYGLVSRHGAMPLSWSMDKIGPICRSADDCGLVLHAIAGKDENDPGSADKSFYYTPQYAPSFKDLHVGFASVDIEEWADPAARPAFTQAMHVLRGLGLDMKPAKLADLPYGAIANTVITAEGCSVFARLIESGEVDQLADPRQIAGLKAGMSIPAHEYLKAMRIRSMIQSNMRDLFAEFDVLVTPSRLGIAPKISDPITGNSPTRPQPSERGLTQLIPVGNLAGLPALSLPCGFADGMPVGISLVGRPFSENTLLAVGREFQKQTDWHKRRPPKFV